MTILRVCVLGWALACLAASAHAAPLQLRDDTGQLLTLDAPARRVISLAPHVTELIYAAGGGPRLVGAVSHSDYPDAARQLPRVGDNRQIDIERVLALKPDLLVVWLHGNVERQLEPLRRLGVPVFYSDPATLEAIPGTLLKLGALLGSDAQAHAAASRFGQRLAALRLQYAQQRPVRVFYQVWDQPLYTLNGQSMVSDVLRLCGGVNIFASLPVVAPTVTQEAVIAADPDVILAGDMGGRSATEGWKRFPRMRAVRHNQLYTLDGDLLHRPGPRMLDGAAQVCERLARARMIR